MTMHKRIFLSILLTAFIAIASQAQTQVVETPRVSPRASISQQLGVTDITIEYLSAYVVKEGEIRYACTHPFGQAPG